MNNAQRKATRNYRDRLNKRGMARFEVIGREDDRELIRALARRLAEEGGEAGRLRDLVTETVAGEPPAKGGILAALRRSPFVGSDIEFSRARDMGRLVDL